MKQSIVPALILAAALAGCAAQPSTPGAQDVAPATPVAQATEGGDTLALYREPCALKAVSNLPYRATWRDAAGKVFEGFYSVRFGALVVAYFEDRTVVAAPLRMFQSPARAAPGRLEVY